MSMTRRIILSSLHFTEKQNIIFLVILKMWMQKLITGLPEDVFYPIPGKNYFFLLGYADGYYIDQKEIKDEFMSCQAIEEVKDISFSISDSYLKIMIYGK